MSAAVSKASTTTLFSSLTVGNLVLPNRVIMAPMTRNRASADGFVQGPLNVTVSLGVASVPHSRIRSAKELIVAADKALYRAKRNGRNQVQAERRREGLARTPRVPTEEQKKAAEAR